MSESPFKVVVAGATGYAGALAAELVRRHPRLELAAVTGRSEVGTPLDRLYPRYRVSMEIEELDLDAAGDADAAIVAYPHGAAAPVVAALRERGVKVVDLSADFRLRDPEVYERWYGEHGAPELLEGAVYGLTEFYRDRIAGADLVANPGCYPTAALLALAPLAAAGLVEDVVVDAKSGVSGAGRGGGDRLSFVNVTENFSPYGVDGHRHEPEIAQELGLLANRKEPLPLTFMPHLLPLDQGLLASCYVRLTQNLEADELSALYEESYGPTMSSQAPHMSSRAEASRSDAGAEGSRPEPFVQVVDHPPGVRDVRDTNLCRVFVRPTGPQRAVAFAAIDNLWKGASSQAIQNLNLMLGLPEGEGLA